MNYPKFPDYWKSKLRVGFLILTVFLVIGDISYWIGQQVGGVLLKWLLK